MKLSFRHTDLLIEHLAQGTKVSSILFDHWKSCVAVSIIAGSFKGSYRASLEGC